jgi:hypothetical protein
MTAMELHETVASLELTAAELADSECAQARAISIVLLTLVGCLRSGKEMTIMLTDMCRALAAEMLLQALDRQAGRLTIGRRIAE